jgi:DNA-binding winged helix-turn-helix (wHTH) protein
MARHELATEPDFRLGLLQVRPSVCRAVHGDTEIRVEALAMSVLVVLAQAGGATVTREELINTCWQGRFVSDEAISRTISKVRGLTRGMSPPPFVLEVVPKVGYRLIPSGATEAANEPLVVPQEPARRRWMPVTLVASGIAAAFILGITFAGWREAPVPAPLSVAGGWYVPGMNVYYSFTSDGHYMQIAADGGIEYGTYDWNPVTKQLTGHPVFDSNGDAGFNVPPRPGSTITPSDAELRFLDAAAPEDDPDRGLTALRNRSATSAIVGTWVLRDDQEGYTEYMSFTPEGRFAMAFYWDAGVWPESKDVAPENRARIGAQTGTYTWNPENGAMAFTLAGADRTGMGLRPNENNQVLLVTGDTMSPASRDDDHEIKIAHRIR